MILSMRLFGHRNNSRGQGVQFRVRIADLVQYGMEFQAEAVRAAGRSITSGSQKMAKTSWGASRFSLQAVAAKKAVSG